MYNDDNVDDNDGNELINCIQTFNIYIISHINIYLTITDTLHN